MTGEITVGSVVQLKSGGPAMTVKEVSSWNGKMTAFCDWFEGSASKSDHFPVTSLKVADQDAAVGPIQVGPTRPWS